AVTDAPQAEVKEEAKAPRAPGKLSVLAARDRDWADGAGPQRQKHDWKFDGRRVAAAAAVVALATAAGALGGAMATAGLMRANGRAASGNPRFEGWVARIVPETTGLKVGFKHIPGRATTQSSRAGDRLDRIEKAQAEPAVKLTRLSEAVEKLRTAPVPLP